VVQRGFLDPELPQVMVEVEVGVPHALGPRHLSKHGVGGIFAFASTEALKQNADIL
jgi:hypothetical protein